jgi:hypothetical protein
LGALDPRPPSPCDITAERPYNVQPIRGFLSHLDRRGKIMDIRTLRAFFKWCTIINVALFVVSAIMILAASDFIYSAHGQLFHMPREAFDVVLYAFLGLYKIAILVFNLAPYVALRIIEKN